MHPRSVWTFSRIDILAWTRGSARCQKREEALLGITRTRPQQEFALQIVYPKKEMCLTRRLLFGSDASSVFMDSVVLMSSRRYSCNFLLLSSTNFKSYKIKKLDWEPLKNGTEKKVNRKQTCIFKK